MKSATGSSAGSPKSFVGECIIINYTWISMLVPKHKLNGGSRSVEAVNLTPLRCS